MALTVIKPSGIDISGNYTVNGMNVSANLSAANLSVTTSANLGAVGNIVITGGTANYVLKTDGAGNLSWTAQSGGNTANVTVDNFTGNGVQTIFTLSTTPIGINQTSVNYNGATVLRTDYTLANANITFSSAPANGSYIEVTTIDLTGGGGSGSPGGANTQVQFNDSGAFAGNTGFTFNKTTGIFTAPYLAGNGNGLSNIQGANVSGAVGTAGTVTTAAQPNITSVGTLTSVSVSGNANVGNLGTAGLITATGNIGGGNINTAGVISATGNATAGNVNSAGTVTASRLVSNVADGTAPFTVTSTTRVSNLNVNYANVADNINVTAPGTGTGYIVFANATTGNVAELTSSGISSNLANNSITATTFVGALSGAATSATTAGTVTTAAQSNITSLGTLTSLSVSGNANVGNIGATSGIFTNVSGNGSALTSITGANVTGQVTYAATANSVAVANVSGIGNIATTNYNGNGSQVLAGNGAWINSSGGGGTSAAAAVGYSLIFGG